MTLLQADSLRTTSWVKEITDFTIPLNNIAAILIAVIGGLLWSYYKRRELKYQILGSRTQAYLDSHKAAWGLLKYLSNKEKPDTIFIWNPETKQWKFNQANANKFTKELNKVYYTDGNGILLEKNIRKKLFEIENKILKCLRNLGNDEPSITEMKNDNVCHEVKKLKDELINELRELVSSKTILASNNS